jgi:hypothetical protein
MSFAVRDRAIAALLEITESEANLAGDRVDAAELILKDEQVRADDDSTQRIAALTHEVEKLRGSKK